MPDELGGGPFPDGDDHGGADEEFASVVFDEEFVRSAVFHEPSAQERMLAAALTDTLAVGYDPAPDLSADQADDPEYADPAYDELYAQRSRRPYRGHHARWHRTVAWVLAVVMGVGVVSLAFAAVYRGASGGSRQPTAPPSPAGRTGTSTAPPVVSSPAR